MKLRGLPPSHPFSQEWSQGVYNFLRNLKMWDLKGWQLIAFKGVKSTRGHERGGSPSSAPSEPRQSTSNQGREFLSCERTWLGHQSLRQARWHEYSAQQFPSTRTRTQLHQMEASQRQTRPWRRLYLQHGRWSRDRPRSAQNFVLIMCLAQGVNRERPCSPWPRSDPCWRRLQLLPRRMGRNNPRYLPQAAALHPAGFAELRPRGGYLGAVPWGDATGPAAGCDAPWGHGQQPAWPWAEPSCNRIRALQADPCCQLAWRKIEGTQHSGGTQRIEGMWHIEGRQQPGRRGHTVPSTLGACTAWVQAWVCTGACVLLAGELLLA